MQDKKGIFIAWSFFCGQLLAAVSFGLLATVSLLPYEGRGVFGLGSLEPYLYAVFMGAAGCYVIHLYRQWKTTMPIRQIYLLFAFTAFYHTANVLMVFSTLYNSFWVNSSILCLMAIVMVRHYFLSKPI